MNYLDLLPNDVMKIINRKVQDAHIIKRRIERKQNRIMNRDQKNIAEHKRYIYEKFAILYNKYIINKKIKNTQKELIININIFKDCIMTFVENMVK